MPKRKPNFHEIIYILSTFILVVVLLSIVSFIANLLFYASNMESSSGIAIGAILIFGTYLSHGPIIKKRLSKKFNNTFEGQFYPQYFLSLVFIVISIIVIFLTLIFNLGTLEYCIFTSSITVLLNGILCYNDAKKIENIFKRGNNITY